MTEAMEYASEITLGESYVDEITGVRGIATELCFSLDGTQRAMLEYGTIEGSTVEPKRSWFDTARLVG